MEYDGANQENWREIERVSEIGLIGRPSSWVWNQPILVTVGNQMRVGSGNYFEQPKKDS
jgi:hypothetical protein